MDCEVTEEITEPYLGPSNTSVMEIFCENNQQLLVVYYFSKEALSYIGQSIEG